MTPAAGDPSTESVRRAAGGGRRLLSDALGELQAARLAGVDRAVAQLAAAAEALFLAERNPHAEEALHEVRRAAEHLGLALVALHEVPQAGEVAAATETVARALALLYPVARAPERRRRAVLAPERGTSSLPPPPVAPARSSQRPPPAGGADLRGGGSRVVVEVDVGLATESNFYAGLSLDLSAGGLFVATWSPQPPGTVVALSFVLPDGTMVEAEGVVRWVREASAAAPPGMGVQFQRLGVDELLAIQRFCQERPPLYVDDDAG
ncbi:MAG: TIGR02266 family protein [Polyangiaceae bacterium]|nr:TIGR02266 family protein [Polyangiaceae bacterium]